MNAKRLAHVALAELLKIWHARFGRIVVVTCVVSVVLPITLIAVLGDQNATTFPGVVTNLFLPTLTLLTGIVSLLLAVSTWGGEYSDRTLGTALIRCPSRWGLLLGKMTALVAGMAVIIVLAVTVETVVASFSHWLQLGGRDLGGHLLALARIGLPLVAIWWLSGLVYAGLVILITVGLRSPALGMAAGLGLFMFDFILGSLGPSGPDAWYVRYLVTNNSYGLIAPLMAGRFDVTAGGMFAQLASLNLPTAPDALATLLCLVGGTLALAYLFLAYRDVK